MSLLFFLQFILHQIDGEKLGMLVYEFYFRDPVKGNEIIGILPERRKDPARTTHGSVLHWAETVLGNCSSNKDTYYIKVTINKNKGNIFRSAPFFANQKEVKKLINL